MIARTEPTSFQSAGAVLRGFLVEPEPAEGVRPGLLFLHGLHSDQNGYLVRAEIAATRLGVSCLTFDLSGHGQSDGTLADLSLRDHLADTLAAYDVLAGRASVDARRIGVCGASYGGYLAALVCARRSVKRLLLRAPALYRDADFDVPLAARGKTDVLDSSAVFDSNALEALRRYDGDVMIVESEFDEVIPRWTIEAYASACKHESHVVIPGVGHTLEDDASREAFVELIVSWFGSL